MSGATSETDPLAYLMGTWRLRRELLDSLDGSSGYFEGSASFDPEQDGSLTCLERGELVWPTYRGLASRMFRYEQDTAGRLSVCFHDGRPFHLLELRTDGFDAVHHCGQDTYAGHFVLLSKDRWSASWKVSGPAKSLELGEQLREN